MPVKCPHQPPPIRAALWAVCLCVLAVLGASRRLVAAVVTDADGWRTVNPYYPPPRQPAAPAAGSESPPAADVPDGRTLQQRAYPSSPRGQSAAPVAPPAAPRVQPPPPPQPTNKTDHPAPKRRRKHRRKHPKKAPPPPEAPGQQSDHISLEVGTQVAARGATGALVRGITYVQEKTSIDFTDGMLHDGMLTWTAGWRAWLDATQFEHSTQGVAPDPDQASPLQPVQNWARQAQIRQLSLAYTRGWLRTEIGIQEVSWGETFGTQVVDVVNPRDLSDPLYTDLSWIRVPVAAVNTQLFLGGVTLQGIYVPVPLTNIYPQATSAYSPIKGQPNLNLAPPTPVDGSNASTGMQSSEYGGRLSYLAPFGLDLGLIYYNHWNRNAVYQIAPGNVVSPYETVVTTGGVTASLTLGPVVFRQDAAENFNQPLQSDQPGQVITNTVDYQSVTGLDLTLFSNFFIGAQYQTEFATYSGGSRRLQWAAGKMQKPFFNERLNFEVFYLHGLDNQDEWIQPTVTWTIVGGLSLSLRGDFVTGSKLPSQGYLYTVYGESRYLSTIVFKI